MSVILKTAMARRRWWLAVELAIALLLARRGAFLRDSLKKILEIVACSGPAGHLAVPILRTEYACSIMAPVRFGLWVTELHVREFALVALHLVVCWRRLLLAAPLQLVAGWRRCWWRLAFHL